MSPKIYLAEPGATTEATIASLRVTAQYYRNAAAAASAVITFCDAEQNDWSWKTGGRAGMAKLRDRADSLANERQGLADRMSAGVF